MCSTIKDFDMLLILSNTWQLWLVLLKVISFASISNLVITDGNVDIVFSLNRPSLHSKVRAEIFSGLYIA